jgi:hypothetical protein
MTCQVRVDAVAIATAPLGTPGELHAATTCALNSALCVRPASTASADVVGNSVHVSTKDSVDTSILKRSAAFKVPRLRAYALTPAPGS